MVTLPSLTQKKPAHNQICEGVPIALTLWDSLVRVIEAEVLRSFAWK